MSDDNTISFGEYEEFFSGPHEDEMSFQYDEIKCPECNGPMISRTGKFGVFWGCKKFPECKGTRDNLGRSKKDRAIENQGRQFMEDKIMDWNDKTNITFNKGTK